MAFAPYTDPEGLHSDIYREPDVESMFPGIREFDRKFSPIKNADARNCRIFLFHSVSDKIVDFKETERYKNAKLESRFHDITYDRTGFYGHHESMIRLGIPSALSWLKKIDK